MRMVVKIDGVEVMSDLEVIRVSGTSVYFTDGSSCDTATGTVSNIGCGSIVLQGSKSKISRAVSNGSGTAIVSNARSTLNKGDGNAIASGGGTAIIINGDVHGGLRF